MILWNHDLRAPLFWARCVVCREGLSGPFLTLAEAQGPTSVCETCAQEQSRLFRVVCGQQAPVD